MPHPNLVPVSPSCSRTTQRSGVSGSTSTRRSFPLTLNSSIAFPLRRTDQSQTQAVSGDGHRAKAPARRREDRIGEGRSHGHGAGFADPAQLLSARYELGHELRRLRQIRELVAIEIALHGRALVERDLGLAV